MNPDTNNSFLINQEQYVYQGITHFDKSNSCLFAEGVPNSCDFPIIQMVPPSMESDMLQHPRISTIPSQSMPSFQFTQANYDSGLLYHGGLQLRGYGNSAATWVNSSCTSNVLHVPQCPEIRPSSNLFPEDAQYYVEIQKFLENGETPLGSTDKYKAHLAEKSEHYQIIDGFLYHGKKRPKQVVIKKEEQVELLQKNHIIGDTGVHRGVKKMFNILKDQAFWRGMYNDILTFVRECSKCSDSSQPISCDISGVLKEENLPICEKSIQTSSNIWKNVEVGLFQFSHVTVRGNDAVLTLCDPESLYIAGWPVSSRDSDKSLASHVISAFALLGLPAQISFTSQRVSLLTEINSQLAALAPGNQVQLLQGPPTTPWLLQLLNIYVSSKRGLWDLELDTYIFQWCSGKTNKDSWSSPFNLMFCRRYPSANETDDKENINENSLVRSLSDDDVDEANTDESTSTSFMSGQNADCANKNSEFKQPKKDVKMTVSEVKAILSETKDSRRKRGKYQKYHPEVQELMTEFAKKKGSSSTSQIFSKVLRTRVSESTVRNLIKAQLNLHPVLKAEIGKYAFENGPDKACRVYSSKLHMNLPMNLVRKLQTIYFTRLTRKKNEEAAKRRLKIETLSEKVKYDIGFFASSHSNEETVQHFMEKGIDIDEEVVKEVVKEIVRYLHPNSLHLTDCNQKIPQENMSLMDLLKHPLLKEPEPNSNIFGLVDTNHSNKTYQSTSFGQESLLNNDLNLLSSGIEALLEGQSNNSGKQSKSKEASSKKRGHYSAYSPELRAEIGKYAAEHGPLKASVHFTNLLGREIPESTARGLKEKYLKKAKSEPVTSLGFRQRGRPLRLGKYDEAVQECLRQLVRSGEKVTSFMVITTAKKIVSKYEPSLLKENGGLIDLNVSWAKSFLKRIGVTNKS